ncbi:MAG: M48 family metalloprotease, partial [Pseudomonadales bacterium]|nr:M48 family metalloprotease [Pseudomonadales bacterium]
EGEGGLGMIGHMAVVFVFDMIFGILASIIVMKFSRWREFRADQAGAQLADKGSMISALQRLKAEMELPNDLPDTMVAFGIRNSKVASLLSSHPPLDARIEALKNS